MSWLSCNERMKVQRAVRHGVHEPHL